MAAEVIVAAAVDNRRASPRLMEKMKDLFS
jgi:hypothetical protein